MSSKDGVGRLSEVAIATHSIQRGISKWIFSSRNSATACSFAALVQLALNPYSTCCISYAWNAQVGCLVKSQLWLSQMFPVSINTFKAKIGHTAVANAYQTSPTELRLGYLVAQWWVNDALRDGWLSRFGRSRDQEETSMTSTLIHQRGRSTVILRYDQLGCYASATLTEANHRPISSAPDAVKSAVSQQMEHLGALKIAECSESADSSFLHVSQPGVELSQQSKSLYLLKQYLYQLQQHGEQQTSTANNSFTTVSASP